jgi:ESS family glutamate:Na+ symporter
MNLNLEGSFHPFFTAFALFSVLLLTGVLIRARFSIFQHYLVPASLIGGLLGFILVNIKMLSFESSDFTTAAFHLFSLSNISIGLAVGGKIGGNGKQLLRGGLWMALVFTLTVSLQALAGNFVFTIWNLIGYDAYEGLGFLAGLGFSQGPGQTIAIADIWESTYAIDNAITTGIAFAAMGYLISLLVGVPLANKGIRKGMATHAPSSVSEEFKKGIVTKINKPEAGVQTTVSANIDTLAFHLALVVAIYGLSYLFCYFLKYYVLDGPAKNLTFNYIYAFGLLFALLTKWILRRFKIDYLIDTQLQNRITGSLVDFLIIATLLSIEISLIVSLLIPILIIGIIVTAITVILILRLGKRSGPEYGFERSMLLFGTCSGSVATGLLLIRILDPDFKTPVILEISLMNLIVPVFVAHIIFLIGLAPDPSVLGKNGMTMVFIATAIVMIILLYASGFLKKKYY